jgi:diguanylate cyclase (GGDEF)-like protein
MSIPVGDAPLLSARERPPRLVLPFVVFTALGVAAAAAVILLIVRHTDTAEAERQAIDRARFATEAVLRPELRAADLSTVPSEKRKRQLDRLFEGRVLLEGLTSATLYRSNGLPTYSTSDREIPLRVPARLLREVGSGAVVSEVTTAADGSRALVTYLPLGLGPGGRRGVVGLEQDHEPIETAARRSSWLIAGVLQALLALLALAFIPVLARVSSRMRRQIAELDRIATHDELTGLPNRRGLQRAAEEMLENTRSGALLLLDLDGFSEINDSLGVENGDALLSQVAARLQFELDECECVARLGEDEFGVLLRDGGRAEIDAVADQVASSLASPFVVDGVRIGSSVQIGAALVEFDSDFHTLLRRAGTALSVAKEEGQRGVQICGPEHDLRDVSRLAVVAELRDALERGELLLHYQPQSDLTTRRIRGVEALLRWDHPEDGLLPAAEFISYVERSGLAREIRRFVLETAATQWQLWSDLGLDLELAVNLSPIDTLDACLSADVSSLIDRHGIPPWRLILEVNERMLIADERRARRVLNELDDIGVRLAIDDFGTGYSSLASLRRFAVHQVKLDRSLLAGVPGDAAAEAIVGGCVEIAHGVGATVVAEGIETKEQWQFVSLMGCDIAQGHLIGRPVPADELTARLDVPSHVPLIAV